MTEEALEMGNRLMKTVDGYQRLLQRMNECPLQFQCKDVTVRLPEEEAAWMYETLERRIKTVRTAFDSL